MTSLSRLRQIQRVSKYIVSETIWLLDQAVMILINQFRIKMKVLSLEGISFLVSSVLQMSLATGVEPVRNIEVITQAPYVSLDPIQKYLIPVMTMRK
jgi:hypothetical protein